jgi:hypothetical protein
MRSRRDLGFNIIDIDIIPLQRGPTIAADGLICSRYNPIRIYHEVLLVSRSAAAAVLALKAVFQDKGQCQ